MFAISVLDADGRDVMQAGGWLPVGKEYHASLQAAHRVTIGSGDRESASAVVRRAATARNAVRIDSLKVAGHCSRQLLAALLHCALREARIVGRTLADIEPGDYSEGVGEILRTSRALAQGARVRQRVDYGLSRTFAESGGELQAALADTFPAEVVRTVEHHLEGFFSGGAWAGAVRGGVLSRRQYVATLFNLHSYVRYTTRLLGHCIGLSEDRQLRGHYIEHLKGEINHELIIERDLTNLGEDVEYVTRFHQPTPSTLGFMCIQESIVAFHRDPVLFLACPISAESFAAYVQADVLEGLKRSIGAWGLDNPAEVMHFVKSHSGFDGGPDGHWNRCVRLVQAYVRAEPHMQRFSSVVHAAMSALGKNFDSCVLEHAENAPADGGGPEIRGLPSGSDTAGGNVL